MARRPCPKRVAELPEVDCFKPSRGLRGKRQEVFLSVEELEALRLAHREGLYQQEASQCMGVSRTTYGRVLDSAHKKVTQALLDGCALKIEGGYFRMIGCERCEHCPKVNPGADYSHCMECPYRKKGGAKCEGSPL